MSAEASPLGAFDEAFSLTADPRSLGGDVVGAAVATLAHGARSTARPESACLVTLARLSVLLSGREPGGMASDLLDEILGRWVLAS